MQETASEFKKVTVETIFCNTGQLDSRLQTPAAKYGGCIKNVFVCC